MDVMDTGEPVCIHACTVPPWSCCTLVFSQLQTWFDPEKILTKGFSVFTVVSDVLKNILKV